MPDSHRPAAWLGIAVLGCALAFPAHGAGDQDALRKDLNSTLKAIDTTSKEQKKLSARREATDKELSGIQKELVAIAARLQAQEKQLNALEQETAALEIQERGLSDDLTARAHELDRLLMSMMKLSIVPPEMALAMPGDLQETRRTAKVLGLTSAAIGEKAAALQTRLQEVQTLRQTIAEKRTFIHKEQANMQSTRQTLEKKLTARSFLQDELAARQENNQKTLKKLAEDSQALKKMLTDLTARKKAEKKAEQEKETSTAGLPPHKSRGLTRPAPERNEEKATSLSGLPLPAQGKVLTAYGENTPEGETSKGIRIRTRGGATVTAPANGEVVYTGPFLDYGNLMIIRHKNKFHSLLAGLEDIQSKTGNNVVKGEPVGRMGRGEQATVLYVEIRKDNKPTDPVSWFKTMK